MKTTTTTHIIFIIVMTFIFFIFKAPLVYATTPITGLAPTAKISPTSVLTPAPSPSGTQEQSQIEKIKQMVAQKVAKLNLVEKRGILGTVKDSTTTQITLVDDKPPERIVEIDELTKFIDSASSSKTFGISDIKPTDLLSCVGLYNKETKHLLARVITRVHSLPTFFEGAILSKDTINYTIMAIDGEGKKRVINVDTSTKIEVYGKDTGMVKAGFSKLQVGQRVFASGFMDANDKNMLNATNVIYFTDVPPDSNMQKFATVNTSITPSPATTAIPTK